VKWRFVIIATLGIALALYLLKYVGIGAVLSAATAIGWGGFAILCGYSLALFLLLGSAWYVLLPSQSAPRVRVFIWARMVRDSAAEVLPFSQFGGIALGARAAILHGISRPLAFGSMIVDVTTEMLAQVAYIALGVAMLSARSPHNASAQSLTMVFAIGLALAAIAGGLFVALQRYGHWMTAKLAARLLPGAAADAAAVPAALDEIYRSPARVGFSATVHFSAWLFSAIGTWIAFRLIGVHVDVVAVMAIESLVYALRSAAFIVPNALGVQEGAYAVLAPLFGVGAEFGLAVSLLKRARDIAIGVPVLLIWQAFEGQRALADRTGGNG
jgi:glycosyltransferase 2 family protein